MRWPFRRRRGKHDLGAAVTGIPSLPVPGVVPASYGALAAPAAPVFAPDAPVLEAPAAVVAEPVAPVVEPATVLGEPEPVPGPRVELGFRDGTALALAPGSDQAKALTDLAQVLTQRDP